MASVEKIIMLGLIAQTHTHHAAESYSSELTNSTSSGDLSHYEVHCVWV